MNEYIVLFDIYVALILLGQNIAKNPPDQYSYFNVDIIVNSSHMTKKSRITTSKISEENQCNLSNKEIDLRLTKNLQSIQNSCGDLCDTSLDRTMSYNLSSRSHAEKIYKKDFNFFTRDIDCNALWNNSLLDARSHFCSSPKQIPYYLYDYFTYHGQIKILPYYIEEKFDDKFSSAVRSY